MSAHRQAEREDGPLGGVLRTACGNDAVMGRVSEFAKRAAKKGAAAAGRGAGRAVKKTVTSGYHTGKRRGKREQA